LKKTKHKQSSKIEEVKKESHKCCGSSSWMIISLILGVLLIVVLILGLIGVIALDGSARAGVLSQSQAEGKANEYIGLLSNSEMPLSVISVNKENGMFVIEIGVLGQTEFWFMSPDGAFLFPQAFSIEDIKNIVGGRQPGAPQAPQTQVSVNLEGAHSIGSGDVLMVEYSSASCPFCARYHSDTFPSIKSEFIDSGKITYVYKHFIRNDVDLLAANAMECAGEQGKFFEYMDLVYVNQNLLGQTASYITWAEQLALDVASFSTCFEEGRYSAKASANTQEGQLNGITGTPGFLINNRLIAGAQPFANFKSAIEAELAN